MASRSQDQELVDQAASRYPLKERTDFGIDEPCRVLPAFGWHPWFSHQLYDDSTSETVDAMEHYRQVLTPLPDDEGFLQSLPAPTPLSKFITETESRLLEHPTALVGEVGLDRAFRLPVGRFLPPGQASQKTNGASEGDYTPGSREGRPLTPYRVVMDHQRFILKAQLELAAKLRRPVSIHSVQAHGVVFELLQEMWSGHKRLSKRQQKRRRSAADAHDVEDEKGGDGVTTPSNASSIPYPPRICMHSYSGPVDPLKQFLHSSVPADIFFSFSAVINFSTPSAAKVTEVIRAVPDTQLLIESDFHCAGEKMDELLLDIIKKVCEIKKWELSDGASQLRRNWERFVFGE